jgi:hypothetical protein
LLRLTFRAHDDVAAAGAPPVASMLPSTLGKSTDRPRLGGPVFHAI